jgi:hypothetical protein
MEPHQRLREQSVEQPAEHNGAQTPEEVLPEAERRRGQTALIRTALCNSVVQSIVQGNVSTVFILGMGGQAIHIGIRSTLANLAPFGQLLGVRLIPRWGKARLGVYGRLCAALPLTLLIGISFVAGYLGSAAPWVAVGAFALLSAINVIGNTGWWPLLQDNTAGETIGTFFSRMRFKLRVMEVGLPMLVGFFLGRDPTSWRFCVPFAMGLGAVLAAASLMRHVPERKGGGSKVGLWEGLHSALAVPAVRSYLAFASVYTLVTACSMAFWAVMLKDQGLSTAVIVWLVPAGAVGHMAGLGFWSRLVDKHGSRAPLTSMIIAQSALGLAWLILPPAGWLLMLWAALFYVVRGFLHGGLLMGDTQAMMHAIPAAHQTNGFTLTRLSDAIFGGVGSFLGGLIFQTLSDSGLTLGGFDVRVLFLCLMQVAIITSLLPSRRLGRHERETPTRQVAMRLWNRLWGEED